jgi:hypothetical protein
VFGHAPKIIGAQPQIEGFKVEFRKFDTTGAFCCVSSLINLSKRLGSERVQRLVAGVRPVSARTPSRREYRRPYDPAR